MSRATRLSAQGLFMAHSGRISPFEGVGFVRRSGSAMRGSEIARCRASDDPRRVIGCYVIALWRSNIAHLRRSRDANLYKGLCTVCGPAMRPVSRWGTAGVPAPRRRCRARPER
jgi:hypothetical protein